MTYEIGVKPGEYIFDIFNPDGIFIGRKSTKILLRNAPLCATMKQNHFYCISEKGTGYEELVVYGMKWE